MSIDQRQSVRIESEQFISYKLFDEEKRVCEEGMALARDISRGGVLIENRTPFDVDAEVEMTIALKNDVIKTKGIVRNVKEADPTTYLIGIQFVEISENELDLLRKEFPNIS